MPDEIIRMTQGEYAGLVAARPGWGPLSQVPASRDQRIGKLIGEPDTVKFAVDNIEDVPKLEKALKEFQKRWDIVVPPKAQTAGVVGMESLKPIDPETEKILKGLGLDYATFQKYQSL